MPVRYTGVVTKMKKGRNFGFIEVIDDNTSFVYDNDIYFHSSYLMEDYIAHTHPSLTPLTPTAHTHRKRRERIFDGGCFCREGGGGFKKPCFFQA